MRKKKAIDQTIRSNPSNRKKKPPAKKAARKKRIARKRIARKPKSPLTRNGGTMTEQEYFNKIRSVLRTGFRWWTPMMNALKKASRPSQSENKRLKTEYQCAKCKQWYARKDVQIDHIIPVGTLRGYDDLVTFVINLTQETTEAYQILCKAKCHLDKTKKERAERKEQLIKQLKTE